MSCAQSSHMTFIQAPVHNQHQLNANETLWLVCCTELDKNIKPDSVSVIFNVYIAYVCKKLFTIKYPHISSHQQTGNTCACVYAVLYDKFITHLQKEEGQPD